MADRDGVAVGLAQNLSPRSSRRRCAGGGYGYTEGGRVSPATFNDHEGVTFGEHQFVNSMLAPSWSLLAA